MNVVVSKFMSHVQTKHANIPSHPGNEYSVKSVEIIYFA